MNYDGGHYIAAILFENECDMPLFLKSSKVKKVPISAEEQLGFDRTDRMHNIKIAETCQVRLLLLSRLRRLKTFFNVKNIIASLYFTTNILPAIHCTHNSTHSALTPSTCLVYEGNTLKFFMMKNVEAAAAKRGNRE